MSIDAFIWDLGGTKAYAFSSTDEDETSVLSKLIIWQSFKIQNKQLYIYTYIHTYITGSNVGITHNWWMDNQQFMADN